MTQHQPQEKCILLHSTPQDVVPVIEEIFLCSDHSTYDLSHVAFNTAQT
jgi:hypothetical protein